MTTTRMHLCGRMAVAGAMAIAVSLTSLGAQAGPPLAKAPRDTQPALKQLKSPSPPPSTVAPRGAANQRAALVAPTDSGARPMQRVSPPVDSVRPAAPTTNTVDPRRAPPTSAPPPAPRANPAVQAATPRAALQSDDPPAGATGRCKDGTWLTGTLPANPCGANGGLAVRIDVKPRPND